jgi:hypothetical protein
MPRGFYPRRSAHERFWEKVNKNGPVPACRPELGPCWLWTACVGSNGYGQFDGTTAHRFSYQEAHGPIPPGLQPDHLCRVRSCIRPSHLEAVTCRENLLRGETSAAKNSAKTHCPKGHPYNEMNTKMDHARNIRLCRICCIERTLRWKAKTGYKSTEAVRQWKLRNRA